MKKKNNLVLIGFMCCGKSTVARKLSKLTNKLYLDCDNLIETMSDKTIDEIFEKYGEKKFRKLEQKLAIYLQKDIKNSIIATGGGFYKVNNLNKIGTIIYLRGDFEYIVDRLKGSDKKIQKRPLLKDIDKAKTLFDKRKKKYEKKADFIVDIKDKTPKEIALEIIKISQKAD